jgi:hypothetical protein
MNLTSFTELPACLRTAAEALGELPDPTNLPRVCRIQLGWDHTNNAVTIHAQLGATDDQQIIAEVTAWADALGTGLHLGDEVRATAEYGYYWRELSTTATLPDGTTVRVWNHLHYPVPAAESAAESAADLIAA